LPTVLQYDPEEIALDGDYTPGDIVYALENIPWNHRPMATVRIDKDVAKFLADALRHRHAASPHR
jgi:hypothetical protein